MNNIKNIKNKFNKAIISFQNISNCSNDLNKAINLSVKALKNKKKIIFCGNGGSAADSQHLTAELVGKFLKNRKAISAISLTTNTSTITSIGNDLSFDKIFSRQLEAIAKKGDVLFAITTSGQSKNILNAIEYACKNEIVVILLTSTKFKKKLKKIIQIQAPAERVDRIQEMHICIGHLYCEEIENRLFKN